MSDDISISKDEALHANIYVHAYLANAGEYNKSPHFRPENQDKVRRILEGLAASLPECATSKAVDFGCGTGFIINLIKDLVGEVHGVDITQDMMKQVDMSNGNITLHESTAEQTSFPDNNFDIATAYSFMDHLFDPTEFLAEAYRVLKPGGVFYSDLNPNRDFVNAIETLSHTEDLQQGVSPIVEREFQGALHNGEHYQEQFGIDADLLEKAEPGKTLSKGFEANEVILAAKEIGFTSCKVEYEWFLGQAKVIHEQPTGNSDVVENYLNSVLPASSHLFKYLRFIFKK